MQLVCKWIAALLMSAGLAACSSTASVAYYPVYGAVARIIDANHLPSDPEPCLASRMAQLGEGKRYAAIRYRKWASHFVATVYAEIPDGMVLHLDQTLEIVPAQCGKNQLAVIVGTAAD